MNIGAVAIDMTKDIAPQLTVTVRLAGIRKWNARVWVATKLMKLSAWIMNVGITFEATGDNHGIRTEDS